MSEFADTDPLGAWFAGDWPPRSEARCWLNAGCIRGYHGVMDEDGCRYGAVAGPGAPAGVEVALGATGDVERAQIVFIGGPCDRQRATLSATPERIDVGGETYVRIDDPDTGDNLGGYCWLPNESEQ